jgi:hypothetical protein
MIRTSWLIAVRSPMVTAHRKSGSMKVRPAMYTSGAAFSPASRSWSMVW